MTARELIKTLALGIASVILVPMLLSFAIRAALFGRDRALEAPVQALVIMPGVIGLYLRRAFLRRTLAYCDPNPTVEFGTLLSKAGARLERNAYIGRSAVPPLGLVHLEPDVLIRAGVHIPSGG